MTGCAQKHRCGEISNSACLYGTCVSIPAREAFCMMSPAPLGSAPNALTQNLSCVTP